MSTIEDRLLRDIATVTEGVVVTDQDLHEARQAIDERIDSDRQSRRRTVVLSAAAAVIVVALGAAAYLTSLGGDNTSAPPADDRPSPTSTFDNHASFLVGGAPTDEDLRGVWRLDNGGVIMRFAAPDLVSWDREGRLFGNPGVQGRYALDGETLRITIDGGPSGCGGRQIALRASVPSEFHLNFVVTQQGEGACLGLQEERLVMEQILPTNAEFAGYEASQGKAGWGPLTDGTRLQGTWFSEGGGYLLEFEPDGIYHLASGTGEQVDYGEWVVRNGNLTLLSWPDSVNCELGEKLVMRNVEIQAPQPSAIRFEVSRNDCGGAWTPKSWLQVPDERSN